MSDLDDKYRDEGWGIVSERALSIRPSDTESQAREVARWAWAEIERLKSALGGEAYQAEWDDTRNRAKSAE